MSSILNWVKKNKLTVLLLFIIIYLLLKERSYFYNYKPRTLEYGYSMPNVSMQEKLPVSGVVSRGGNIISDILPPSREAPPTTNVQNRLVIKESYLALLVDDVVNIQKKIVRKAEELGGYMVNSYLNNPQEAAMATVIVRVPSKKLEQILDYFRGLSVKVVSENLQGHDVTDEYVDIEARLSTLNKTKARFEEIMEKASQVQDILNVQRAIIDLQLQIDSLKGQKKYLEQNAKLTKITVYLSTDELSLPYTPSDPWRPQVIFKQAVRSLINSLRKIGTALIWIAVYAVIWLPVGLVIFFFPRRKKPQTL